MVVETKPKLDLDQFKAALKDITLPYVVPVVIASVNSLKDLAEFAVAIGNLQMKSQEAYEAVLKAGEEPQAFLAILVDRVPADKLKPLVELTLKMSSVQLKMAKFNELSAEEKIATGNELMELASELSKLLAEMKV